MYETAKNTFALIGLICISGSLLVVFVGLFHVLKHRLKKPTSAAPKRFSHLK
jgi:hypothetical protein